MAGYQRFVAYVYEYRKGKKDGSSGYVRVEARDRKCRVEVHLRCVGLEPGSRCRVYGFVRREGLMDGILIGSCVTGQERIECALETDTGDIGGMGKSLQELGGLLLISDAGGFWGTEWDDRPIRPENFREWKKKETEPRKEAEKTGTEYQEAAEKKGRERGEKEEENQKDGTLPEVQEYQKKSDRIMTVEEVQEEVLKASETGNSYQAPGPHPPESPRPGQPSPHPPEPSRPGQPSPHPPETPRPGHPAPHPPKPPRPGQPSPHPPEPSRPGQPSPHPPEPSRPEPSRPLPGIPCDDPFNDGYFTDCRKIRPSDCSALCRQNGCFCSNRFVMYGYQNFGHLLLCRNHQGQYILGVPGGYSQQERFMANMFGFPYFKECPDIHIPGGKGGYWYCFINI